MSIDLASFDALGPAQEAGIDVPINGPDGRPLGFTIRVAGPDSAKQKGVQQAIVDERLGRRSLTTMTAQEIVENGLVVIAESTLGWSKFILEGKEFPFSVANAKALYMRFPWIREQVDAAAGSRADFLRSLQKGSQEQSGGNSPA